MGEWDRLSAQGKAVRSAWNYMQSPDSYSDEERRFVFELLDKAHAAQSPKTGPMDKLPTPRLQFRWVPDQTGEYPWVAVYELVIGLREHDIRRDAAKNANGEMAIELGRTRRGGDAFPLPNDTPYRDGMHAIWDGEQLGDLPIFVIDPNGKPWVETRPAPCTTRMMPALPTPDEQRASMEQGS